MSLKKIQLDNKYPSLLQSLNIFICKILWPKVFKEQNQNGAWEFVPSSPQNSHNKMMWKRERKGRYLGEAA